MKKKALALLIAASYSVVMIWNGSAQEIITFEPYTEAEEPHLVDNGTILFLTLLGKTRNRDAIDFAIAILDICV